MFSLGESNRYVVCVRGVDLCLRSLSRIKYYSLEFYVSFQ